MLEYHLCPQLRKYCTQEQLGENEWPVKNVIQLPQYYMIYSKGSTPDNCKCYFHDQSNIFTILF